MDSRVRDSWTVENVLTNQAWIYDISGKLTVCIVMQFLVLLDSLQGIELTDGVDDRTSWKWTVDGSYSASSAYAAFFAGLEFFPCSKTIWKTWAPAKCKLHIWLAVHRRISTADRMIRHGMQSHTACPLFDQEDETAGHIATGCVFAKEIWFATLSRYGMANLAPINVPALVDWWPDTHARLPRLAKKGFDSLVLLIMWMLWKEHNSYVIEHATVVGRELCQRIYGGGRIWWET